MKFLKKATKSDSVWGKKHEKGLEIEEIELSPPATKEMVRITKIPWKSQLGRTVWDKNWLYRVSKGYYFCAKVPFRECNYEKQGMYKCV